ncbi:MAG: GC-type dockerin domain-anchored protein [Planctomycetota bacterium]
MQRQKIAAAAFTACTAAASSACAGDPPSILFVRGADRSGGFLEAGNDAARTEQLADITNASTSGGNHGWFELAQALQAAGYSLTQITEAAETPSGPSEGIPIDFDTMDLTVYNAIVFGSNNAVYTAAQIDAVEAYIRGGGGAIFISDANFGGSWADASNSDQQFLDRFGIIVHQDRGTYAIERSAGEFLVPDDPIFTDVNAFDGEGVTPFDVASPDADVSLTILANAEGQVRLNNGTPGVNQEQGSSRPATATDAALFVAQADQGRIIGHFDRNTFFNLNGAGTNINRLDNRQYALNLFAFATTPTTTTCTADTNGDGLATPADFNAWVLAFNSQSPACDQNGDAACDPSDFNAWVLNYNSGC